MSAIELSALQALAPVDVQQHLQGHGWRLDRSRADVARYLPPDDARGTVAVELLMDKSFADFSRRMAELVDALAAWEKRSPKEVLDELLVPPADIIRFRYLSTWDQAGFIGIDESLRIRTAQRQMLLAAAHSALAARPHYPRLGRPEATALLAQCIEGPTARGSHVTQVHVPLPPVVGEPSLAGGDPAASDPYPRRVTRVLAAALSDINDLVKQGRRGELLRRCEHGVSSNLLASLADLCPVGASSSLEISMSWARTRPPPPGAPGPKVLDAGFFPVFRAAAEQLRETSPLSGMEVEGHVSALRQDRKDLLVEGEIVVVTELEDRPGLSKLRIVLAPDDFRKATEAHEQAARVRVIGTLVRRGRFLMLEHPAGFEILPPSALGDGDDSH